MNPEFTQWIKVAGSLMVGFFAMNFWIKWLRKRQNVPPWAFKVPALTLLGIVLTWAWGAWHHWQIYQASQSMAPQALKEFTKVAADEARQSVLYGMAVIGVGAVLLLVSTAMSRKNMR